MQVLTQTITISREKSIATKKKFIVWKIGFKVLKPSIKSSIQNNIYFDKKCELFGVKRSMRPF